MKVKFSLKNKSDDVSSGPVYRVARVLEINLSEEQPHKIQYLDNNDTEWTNLRDIRAYLFG